MQGGSIWHIATNSQNRFFPARQRPTTSAICDTDELLALQKSPEELLHKDEMTFLVVHQSSELLLKGAAFELGRALDAI